MDEKCSPLRVRKQTFCNIRRRCHADSEVRAPINGQDELPSSGQACKSGIARGLAKRTLPRPTCSWPKCWTPRRKCPFASPIVDGTITLFNSGAENDARIQVERDGGQANSGDPASRDGGSSDAKKSCPLSSVERFEGFEVFVAYAKEGRFERREWTYVRKDGHHLTVNLVVTAVRNACGEITGFLGVAEDISERKRSEEALRKSEERFDLAVAGSNDGIWDWDVCTGEVYYAPRFKELLGFRNDELAEHVRVLLRPCCIRKTGSQR